MYSAYYNYVSSNNPEVIMQNPTHDKKPSVNKPVDTTKKGAPIGSQTGNKPQVKPGDKKSKGK